MTYARLLRETVWSRGVQARLLNGRHVANATLRVVYYVGSEIFEFKVSATRSRFLLAVLERSISVLHAGCTLLMS